ncbi:MAG: four helix bundle protein [Chitinophagaceae bacterium]|nr:four helix bundle protein [Chitinophagaceae bacterium]
MSENKDNIIVKKSYAFALEVINLYKSLIEKKEFIMSKQILISGTSIGANIHEAVASESKKDFIHKLSIAVKESRETSYWLNLLKDSNYINEELFNNLNNGCHEVTRILNSIIITTKAKYFSNIHNSKFIILFACHES